MSLLSRLRGLWRRDELDADLNEELQAHIAMRSHDNMAAGMGAEEAHDAARKLFGNYTKIQEDTRQIDLITWLKRWRVASVTPGVFCVNPQSLPP